MSFLDTLFTLELLIGCDINFCHIIKSGTPMKNN